MTGATATPSAYRSGDRIVTAPCPSRRSRRREHRVLARRDRTSARLAELAEIRALLGRAVVRVQAGWVQHAWRSYSGAAGETRLSHLPRASVGADDAVCLVTGLRVSGDGPAGRADDQTTARTLDLVWHTLAGSRSGLGLVPPPDARRARVHDLTRWNDRRGRRLDDVVGLLVAADRVAGAEMDRLRLTV